ncbi:hypothetical protein [methane-oxidizing endosymbiont of Gigantopelta aegis]|uniref:hypothetical protein n=1 Tax=methane-oxidizing endosymbiont of Gigantopelta aegis TaxID=2794938 RepID=UPI0018DCC954|nr:hypothetical protein [methane-oxidizing endosymbiont of Gigantopelta aegis]
MPKLSFDDNAVGSQESEAVEEVSCRTGVEKYLESKSAVTRVEKYLKSIPITLQRGGKICGKAYFIG